MNITRPRPPHADPYAPRPYPRPADAPAPTPAPARSTFHRRDAVPGTVGAPARVTASPRTGTPRLVPLRDTVPARTYETGTRQRHGIRHTSTVGRDGFVTDTRAFGDASGVSPIPGRHTVTCADGFTFTDTAPAPAPASPVTSASPAAVTVGGSDLRDACDTGTVTLRSGTVVPVHVDGNGRHVRTVGDDTPWTDRTRTIAPRPPRAPRPASTPRSTDRTDTPPARVSRETVVMWLRATGYAGPVDARMVALARDAMAAQRQRDAYTD